MSGTVNKVILVGNLARDPEVRSFDNGGRVAKMRILTNETWTDKDGNRKEQTEGHDVVTYNDRLVDVIEKYVRKGNKVYVEGMNKTRKWQDSNGNDRYNTEVELPRFAGVLTMLGGPNDRDNDFSSGDDRGDAGQGGGRDNRGGGNERGGRDDRGGNDRGGSRSSGGGGNDRGGRGGFQEDLDDDVPF